MTAFQLANPEALWLLVPALGVGLWALRRRESAAVYSSSQLLEGLPRTLAQRVRWLLPWARLLAVSLLVLALARPQWGRREYREPTESIAIQMCLDRSGSMQAVDFFLEGQRVDRLAAVKAVFREFVVGGGELPGRPDDLIGLISFGGYAESNAPLTLDHEALLSVLDSIQIPQPIYDAQGEIVNRELIQEELATAVGDAVGLAVDRLRSAEAKSRIVILLSDGENNAGTLDPDQAAQAAQQYGIKVYTIGVGRTGQAPFPEMDRFGNAILRPRLVRLDEATLKRLAERTGGQYFHAENTSALAEVYREIDQLEKTPTEGHVYTEYDEWCQWLMAPGLLLLVLECICRATWLRSVPTP